MAIDRPSGHATAGRTHPGDENTARWDPAQYAMFADHRSRPFTELVGRVGATAPRRVFDLGCGGGALTATLARRWPDAEVVGVDNSPEMLASARVHASDRVRFVPGDLAEYVPDGADVVVSNAAYQWIDGHERVLARIARALSPGGWLAVQVPGNFDEPSHRTIRAMLAQQRWEEATGSLRLREDPVHDPDEYADLYAAAGLVPDVWETTYHQVLPGDDPVLEWVKGTALRPVLTALPPVLHDEFLTELAERLRAAYPRRPYGTVFGFRRIFAVGRRPD